MDKPKIHVILASIREGRAGEKIAKWFMETVADFDGADLELVDLKNYQLPIFADAVSPTARQEPHPDPAVRKWSDKVAEADGYIVITPEYNHGYPSALKNNIDYVYKEWNGKAIGFVSYGGSAGGARAVEQLRQVAGELQMYDVRPQVAITYVWMGFDEQGKLKNSEMYGKLAHAVVEAVTKLATQLKAAAS